MHSFLFRWENFRSFEDTDWVEIKPLTIVLGSNNSGKSSLLAPLLLMKQTLDSPDIKIPLMLKGPLINAGAYRDLINNHDETKNLTFSLRFHHHKQGKKEPSLGAYPPGGVSAQFKIAHQNAPNDVELVSYKVFDVIGRPYLERIHQKGEAYSLAFHPTRPKLDTKTSRRILTDSPQHFIFTDDAVHDMLTEKLRKGHGPRRQPYTAIRGVELSPGASLYFAVVSLADSELNSFFEKINHLGPLREPPKRIYELSGDTPRNIGVKGEYAPEILARRMADSDRGSAWIQHWIKTFEYGGKLKAEKAPYDSFFLDITRSVNGPESNLADMGFGLSQILPLIVTGAYSPQETWLITEQPEIHLNPRLQAILADLFVEMVNNGQGVVVETHSEHLLLRLRRLIAEKKISADDVALLFVEKEEGASKVRSILVKENGHITSADWPKGFFEDSLRESLALASSQSKRRKR